MSKDKNGSPLVVVTQEEDLNFREEKIKLRKLQIKLEKLSDSVIATLEKCLESPDEKLRFQAAKALMEFQVSVAEKINTDQLQRMIAQVKFSRNSQKQLVNAKSDDSDEDDDDEPKKTVATINFTEIQDITS